MKPKSLPMDSAFATDITGEGGPTSQFVAFRACWDRAHAYIRLVRQTTLGCAQTCSSDPAVLAELEALHLMMNEVENWFASCGDDLRNFEKSIEQPKPAQDRAMH